MLLFPQVLKGLRELRKAGRNHIHLSWYVSDAVVTRYKVFPLYIFGFNTSGVMLGLRVLIGKGRSGMLRGRILSQ